MRPPVPPFELDASNIPPDIKETKENLELSIEEIKKQVPTIVTEKRNNKTVTNYNEEIADRKYRKELVKAEKKKGWFKRFFSLNKS